MLVFVASCAAPHSVEQASSWARSLSVYQNDGPTPAVHKGARASSLSCLVTAARDLASPLELDGMNRRGRCAPIAEAPRYCSGVKHAVPYWGDSERVGQIDKAVERCVAQLETTASPECARLARSFLCATRFPRCVVGSDATVHAGCAQLCEQLQAHECPGADELSCGSAPRCSTARPERWQGCYDHAPSCTAYHEAPQARLPPSPVLPSPSSPPPPPSLPVSASQAEATAAKAASVGSGTKVALDSLEELDAHDDAHDDEAPKMADAPAQVMSPPLSDVGLPAQMQRETQRETLDSRIPPEGPTVVSSRGVGGETPDGGGNGHGGDGGAAAAISSGTTMNATKMPMVFFLGPGKNPCKNPEAHHNIHVPTNRPRDTSRDPRPSHLATGQARRAQRRSRRC